MKRLTILFVVIVTFLFINHQLFAGYKPPFGGEYTNLCGSATDATLYSCPGRCDINQGSCTAQSGQYIYSYVCNGKLTDLCSENVLEYGPGTTLYVTQRASVGSNKTVQLDIFNKKCFQNGIWVCQPQDLVGYVSWYSGGHLGESATILPPQVITLPPTETL